MVIHKLPQILMHCLCKNKQTNKTKNTTKKILMVIHNLPKILMVIHKPPKILMRPLKLLQILTHMPLQILMLTHNDKHQRSLPTINPDVYSQPTTIRP